MGLMLSGSTHVTSLLVSALLLAVLALGCASNGTGDQKPVIRLHDSLGESQKINNAIAKFIIENGYGYPVETVVASTPMMQESLPAGVVDLNLEGWQQNILEWYDAELAKGTVVNLGMIFEGGPQFFMIPRWVADQYNINTVADMKAHWELFRDPQDPSKGVFYNCISGWECATINQVKLEAYGLDEYYNIVSPASSIALTAALEGPQKMTRPVFGYYWQPSPLAAAYQWHVLEEPPYIDDCWDQVIAATENPALRPIAQACAYESRPVDKLAHAGLQEKAPELVEMLRAMMVGLDPINKTMAWFTENDVEGWDQSGVYYLRNYEDRWRSWVTPEAYDRIKDALDKLPQTIQ